MENPFDLVTQAFDVDGKELTRREMNLKKLKQVGADQILAQVGKKWEAGKATLNGKPIWLVQCTFNDSSDVILGLVQITETSVPLNTPKGKIDIKAVGVGIEASNERVLPCFTNRRSWQVYNNPLVFFKPLKERVESARAWAKPSGPFTYLPYERRVVVMGSNDLPVMVWDRLT